MTSSSIAVQWQAADSIHHNDNITNYIVRYGVKGSVEGNRMLEVVPGGLGNVYMISELTPSTTYIIEVAAVNTGLVLENSVLHSVCTL